MPDSRIGFIGLLLQGVMAKVPPEDAGAVALAFQALAQQIDVLVQEAHCAGFAEAVAARARDDAQAQVDEADAEIARLQAEQEGSLEATLAKFITMPVNVQH